MSVITVLGSANMDLVVTTERAPGRGETVTGRNFTAVAGGKGANQALAAARAGGEVRFLGAVGEDTFGRTVGDVLRAAGIDVSGLARVPTPTGTAHITVDGDGDNSIVVVPGANGTLTALTDVHRRAIAGADALLLQLELPLSVVVEAARFAREVGVRTVLTPAPAVPLPRELLEQIDLLVPNEHEAMILSGTADPEAASEQLARQVGEVVVTLGAAGALLRSGESAPLRVPAFPASAVDTTAAGDTFVGVLTVALADGSGREAALRRASAAAAIAVGRFGASSSMPDRSEIDDFLTAH